MIFLNKIVMNIKKHSHKLRFLLSAGGEIRTRTPEGT